jgi:hypothetical protein
MSPQPLSPRRRRPDAAAAEASSPEPQPAVTGLPFADASPEARRLAAAILEVLAGTQMPSEAARAVGLSLPRYYQLELRAVAGLVAACERRRGGRGRSSGGGVAELRRECERLRRECARQQALVRATRRTVGLTPSPPPPPPEAGRKRRRRPTARALKMAALLQPQGGSPPADPPAAAGSRVQSEAVNGLPDASPTDPVGNES